MNASLPPPRRALIIQTAFPGDVMLTLPLLQKLKALFPSASIDFLAIPTSKNLLETNPDIDQLLIYDKHGTQKGIGHLLHFIKLIRRNRYDLAVVPHRSLRSAMLARAGGIPYRIGFNRSAGRYLFTHIITYRRDVHEINRNLYLLSPFGVNGSEKIFPKLYFSDEDQSVVQYWFHTSGLQDNDEFIALAPGSVWATKRWLPEYFAQLANRLAEAGYEIVLVGGEDDRAVAEKVMKAASVPLRNAVGRLTFRQSAMLIGNARLIISNDSAPMHLAVAVGTPVVAIFGPTVPAFGFYPYGKHDRVIEIPDLSCRPCGLHGGNKCPIGTFDCMKRLLPEQVYRVALEVLQSTPYTEKRRSGEDAF